MNHNVKFLINQKGLKENKTTSEVRKELVNAGISNVKITRLLNNAAYPINNGEIKIITDFFGCSYDELFSEDETELQPEGNLKLVK